MYTFDNETFRLRGRNLLRTNYGNIGCCSSTTTTPANTVFTALAAFCYCFITASFHKLYTCYECTFAFVFFQFGACTYVRRTRNNDCRRGSVFSPLVSKLIFSMYINLSTQTNIVSFALDDSLSLAQLHK